MGLTRGETVAVVTGASSGVGRATALALAEAGARVVLAARGEPALEAAAQACRALGAEAVAVPTDVADAAQVEALAQAAQERFGRVDLWANIAGVGAVGGFLDTPLGHHAQTVRTNLLGAINGSYAALSRFKAQNSGVLVNMNSVGAFAAAPYAAAYSASKFGLRGLSLALRGELAGTPGVHVCEVYGAFLDTPGVEHAANFTGRRLRPAPPVNDPAKVGRVIVDLLDRPRAEVMLDSPALLISLGARVLPRSAAWGLGRFVELYTRLAERAPKSEGAVLAPAGGPAASRGGLRSPALRAGATVAAVAAGVSVLALAARARASRNDDLDG